MVIRIKRLPVQIPLDAPPGLGIQPCYEAPDDLRVKYVRTQLLTSGE